MSKKLCVLGNSHMASFILAADAFSSDWPGVTLEFFGAHGTALDSYTVEQGRFQSDSAGDRQQVAKLMSRDSFDVDAYDGFVIIGLSFSIFQTVRALGRSFTLDRPSITSLEDVYMHEGRLLSQNLTQVMLHEALIKTLGFKVASRLKQATSAPVFIASQPRPSSACLKQGQKYSQLGFFQRIGEAQHVSDLYNRQSKAVCAAENITFVPQNTETIENYLFTRAEYMRDAPRLTQTLKSKQNAADVLHANAEYARLVIKNIASLL